MVHRSLSRRRWNARPRPHSKIQLRNRDQATRKEGDAVMPDKVSKTDAEWKAVLVLGQRRTGALSLLVLRHAPFRRRNQIRCRLRMAEFLRPGRGRKRPHRRGQQPSDAPHRSLVRNVRRTSRPRLRRRSTAHRTTLLHELRIAQVRAEESVTLCACCSPKTMR
jgi:hypothetical protein